MQDLLIFSLQIPVKGVKVIGFNNSITFPIVKIVNNMPVNTGEWNPKRIEIIYLQKGKDKDDSQVYL